MLFIIYMLLKIICLDVFFFYYNCLVGGGYDYQVFEKIKVFLNEKFYLLKMYNDIILYVRLCDRC